MMPDKEIGNHQDQTQNDHLPAIVLQDDALASQQDRAGSQAHGNQCQNVSIGEVYGVPGEAAFLLEIRHGRSDPKMAEITQKSEDQNNVCYIPLTCGTQSTCHNDAGKHPKENLENLGKKIMADVFAISHQRSEDFGLFRNRA